MYVDYEATAKEVAGRLEQLGASRDDQRRGLMYFDAEGQRFSGLDRFPPWLVADLVVIDGITAALTANGFDVVNNRDVAAWFGLFPRPLAKRGACVLLVDHVTRDGAHHRYALGAQHKLAAIDGAAFEVKVSKNAQPAPGAVGHVRLLLQKDRHGALRGAGIGRGDVAAVVTFDSTEKGRIRVAVTPATQPRVSREAECMEKVSRSLEGLEQPAKRTWIYDRVDMRREVVRKAIEALLSEGYVEEAGGTRFPPIRSVREFRAN